MEQSAGQQISWTSFKYRYCCRGKSIAIYCFTKGDVSQPLTWNIRHDFRELILDMGERVHFKALSKSISLKASLKKGRDAFGMMRVSTIVYKN